MDVVGGESVHIKRATYDDLSKLKDENAKLKAELENQVPWYLIFVLGMLAGAALFWWWIVSQR